MDKIYDHKLVETDIYKIWEESGYFKPEVHPDGKPYTIILPPPNANAPLHFGHAMMVLEDILIRYHRMKGEAALWVPGADHAGFETQFVFEKKLQAEGKSRFDFSREELYSMIWDHVQTSKAGMENQLRKLGFSLDWSREKFTLDPDVVKLVYKTFKKMHDEGLIYRDYRLVNYCTRDGTSFSDLEANHKEQTDPLYYIKYGPFVIATVRPETKFGDTALAVNPNDTRYNDWIGKEVEAEGLLGKFNIKVIGDEGIDPEFGTGVAKVTPSIDFKDFEMGKKHNLEMKMIVGFDGKLTDIAGPYAGLYVKEARKRVAEDLEKAGLMDHVDENYTHTITTCYKCGMTLEPLPLEQWFIKVKPLTEKAIAAVKDNNIGIYPDNFKTLYFQWLENLRDWNISRQTVWGMRIPAWKNTKTNEWRVTDGDAPVGSEWEQDTDTFDTWFSSGQWPFVTLQSLRVNPSGESDFEKFYPTSVMETGYDILRAWVSRMVMMGIYATGEVPFQNVVLHGLVNDPLGKKMSKSKGNVVNPMELIEQYGADAVRFALVYGTGLGNDQSLSYPKLDAMRKFTNKLWNMARFIQMNQPEGMKVSSEIPEDITSTIDREWFIQVKKLSEEISQYLESYHFNLAAETLYEFIWHQFADKYIEDVKNRINENSFAVLSSLFLVQLKLLHPFMPFVTEELYKQLGYKGEMLIISDWPLSSHA